MARASCEEGPRRAQGRSVHQARRRARTQAAGAAGALHGWTTTRKWTRWVRPGRF